MQTEKLRALIELSETNIQADEYIEKYTGYTDISRKFAFVKGMFSDIIMISKRIPSGQSEDMILSDDYYATLQFIVNKKWR
jgi:hypothetical protein